MDDADFLQSPPKIKANTSPYYHPHKMTVSHSLNFIEIYEHK